MTDGRGSVALARRQIRIRGVVQGVGFRPFVHNLAHAMGLAGYVLNSSAGVVAEVEGASGALDRFVERLRGEAPPLARIEEMSVAEIDPLGEREFTNSRQPGAAKASSRWSRPTWPPAPIACATSPIPPTGALAIRSPTAPIAARATPSFATSPTTGPTPPWPRFACAPPARPNTTIRPTAASMPSPMPARCAGPRTFARRIGGSAQAAACAQGEIVAIKGLGGFHLACDARNAAAVRRLRERKRRSDKPFALMARDLAAVERILRGFGRRSRALLSGPRRPIVLLPRRADSRHLRRRSRRATARSA